jgi:hypothetical protein
MSADKERLGRSTQAYRLGFNVLSPRNWQLKDVAFDGSDEGAAEPDPAVDLGPTEQFFGQPTLIEAFDGIRDVSISGTVDGGMFTIPLVVPVVPASFPEFYGVELTLRTWHGNVPGVVGGSGIDPDDVFLCRGYTRGVVASSDSEIASTSFDVRSTTSFWQDSQFSRSIDYHPSLPHGTPGTPAAIIRHLVDYHSNSSNRSILGIYLPAHDLGTSFSVNKGSLYSMIKQLCDNAALVGWVYAGRNDNIRATAHPNMIGDLYYNYYVPIIDYDDSIVIEWEFTQLEGTACAQCSITMVHSDQTEEVIDGYAGRGLGSRDPFTVRTDDISVVNNLNARYLAHANREFPRVRVRVPLNAAADLGDIVTCSPDGRYNNRNISWSEKKFVVVGLEYDIQTQEQQFSSWLTLDQVVG